MFRIFLAVLLSLLAQISSAHDAVDKNAHAQAPDCALMGANEAQAFLEKHGKYPDIDPRPVVSFLRPCEREIESQPRFECLRRLYQFSVELLRRRRNEEAFSHSLGFSIPNEQYRAAHPKGLMSLPPDLSKGLPSDLPFLSKASPSGLSLWVAKQGKGWTGFGFVSTVNGSPRFLIQQETPTSTKWMLVSGSPRESKLTNETVAIDVIAVDKSAKPPRIYFEEYTYKDGGYRPARNTDRCTDCHIGGLINVRPVPGSVSWSGSDALRKINDTIDRTRDDIDWNGTFSVTSHGPHLGKNQGCTDCHNGMVRPPLTAFTHRDLLYSKLVHQLAMPPSQNADLGAIHEQMRRSQEDDRLLAKYREIQKNGPSYPNVTPDLTVSKVMEHALTRPGSTGKSLVEPLQRHTKKAVETYDAFFNDRVPEVQAWLTEIRCALEGEKSRSARAP